jgi:Putative prokaryotic signal transducing protein
MSDLELVVVKTFLTRIDADLAKGALESAGIEAIVRPDDAGGVRPNLWMGGVGLLVRVEDLNDARQILGED